MAADVAFGAVFHKLPHQVVSGQLVGRDDYAASGMCHGYGHVEAEMRCCGIGKSGCDSRCCCKQKCADMFHSDDDEEKVMSKMLQLVGLVYPYAKVCK